MTAEAQEEEVFLFDELELAPLAPARPLAGEQGLLMAGHMQFLLRPTSTAAAKLARDVEVWALRRSLKGGQPAPHELAAALAARGWSAAVVKSVGGGPGVAAFRNLSHTFIGVAPPQPARQQQAQQAREPEPARDADAACPRGDDLIVDSHFACQFVLASPSPRYAALQRLLPATFVGSREQLEYVVEWLSREMAWSFKQQQVALPPWREHAAMLSKWTPRAAPAAQPGSSAAGAPAGSSPPCAPCCCCCHGGGERSPSSVLPASAVFSIDDVSSPHASSTPSTPTHHRQPADAPTAQPRVSLLSKSLEAAGLPARLRRSSTQGGGKDWWQEVEPRIVVVRRSGP